MRSRLHHLLVRLADSVAWLALRIRDATARVARDTGKSAAAVARRALSAWAAAVGGTLAVAAELGKRARASAGLAVIGITALAVAGRALGARVMRAAGRAWRRATPVARWTYLALTESAGELIDFCRPAARWGASLTARGGRRLAFVLLASTVVGLVAAAINMGAISVPTSDRATTDLHVAAATSHVMLDMPDRSIVDRRAQAQELATLIKRAELMGRAMITPPVLADIGKRAGLPADAISGIARTTASVPIALTEPGSEQRADEIVEAKAPYRLEIQARPTSPILDVYALAPSVDEAIRLANAATLGLRDYLESLAHKQDFPADQLVELRQLGPARGASINGKTPLLITVLSFFTGFGLTCLTLLGLMRMMASRGKPRIWTATAPDTGDPSSPHAREPAELVVGDSDDWPHTPRVLPWMLAAFIALLWLVPFNSIQLNASLPIDMKLDRLMLPFIIGTWILSIAVGGRSAPKLRLTWIHIALLAFLTCAIVSVVLDAPLLSNTLEFEISLKKLPLLLSYVTVFLMFASVVRRSEVAAFLKYTLGLGIVCAIGIVYEYRFKQNLFTDVSHAVLPGMFEFPPPTTESVDSLGRQAIVGPTEVGLEAVSMLSMALPIALVALMRSERWRDRILYGLAACALVAATFATLRKSAILAPISVFATLAYFRRRELVRLAPLAVVLIVVVSAVSPGALGSTLSQFTRSDRSEVATVSDRTSDYDAIRPDLWSHLAFGRGWGAYNHESYRILDSEILHRVVEMGVIGLIAYLMLPITVVLATRRTIAERDPVRSPQALVGAAAAVCFLVLSTLYDVLSFPHATYIFLYLAGLAAVVVGRDDAAEERHAEPPAKHSRRLRSRRARRPAAEHALTGRAR